MDRLYRLGIRPAYWQGCCLPSSLPNRVPGGGGRQKVYDWQVISYGNALHGFTNPPPTVRYCASALYNAQADRRSWASMRGLFDEVLA